MYQYIYDSFLSNKKYDKILANIEARLIDLGIKGKINKLTVLKNFESYIKDVAQKKSDCLVVVGDDRTLAKILNIVIENDVILGFIPIGDKNIIADFFGIPKENTACEVLSARKIEEIDLGIVGGQYFLSSVEVFGEGISIICNNKYEIKTLAGTEKIGIYNLCLKGPSQNLFNPKDEMLELVSIPKQEKTIFNFKKKDLKETIIKIKRAKILSSDKSNSVLVDSGKIIKTPVEVKVAEKKLKIIVGKMRKF